MRYMVLSYGRHDIQITLKNIPEKHLKDVELWVVPSEYKAYRKGWYANKVKSINCWPKHIDCAPKKRKYVATQMKDEHTMLIDDDINLYVWSDKAQRFVRPEQAPKRFEKEWTERIPELFEKHMAVSLGNKFMADPWVREHGTLKKDTIGYVFTGYSKKAPTDEIKHNRLLAFADIAIPLQVYQKTRDSVIYYGLCYNHAGSKKLENTGVSSYRDDFINLDSALKMGRLFPGIVTGLKWTGNKGGGFTLTKWFSRVKKGVSDSNIEATTKWLEQMKEEHGLKKLPKMFEYEDEMPRAEIIKTFKDNWEKAKK
jgi:hypothetical protein